MKRFVLLLIVALAGTALAQVTAADYQAWRRAERNPAAAWFQTTYQAWRASEQATYHQQDGLAYQAWRAAEQASYRQQDGLAYHAWRAAEQAGYQQLDSADLRAWLGGGDRQESDTARNIRSIGIAGESSGVAVRAGPAADPTFRDSSAWFTQGRPSDVAAAPQPESIILRGVADPTAVTTLLPSTQAQPVYMPRKSEFFEP